MNEIKLAQTPAVETTREPVQPASEIQLLSDLELGLAGGGDTVSTWP